MSEMRKGFPAHGRMGRRGKVRSDRRSQSQTRDLVVDWIFRGSFKIKGRWDKEQRKSKDRGGAKECKYLEEEDLATKSLQSGQPVKVFDELGCSK